MRPWPREEKKEGPPEEKRELSKAELQHKQDIREAFSGHLPNDPKKVPESGAPLKMNVPEPKGELSAPTKSLKALPPKEDTKEAAEAEVRKSIMNTDNVAKKEGATLL